MIIVYGGTFNPPTIAHEQIAKRIIKKYKPKKFIFLPVGDSYTWKDNYASFYHRKNMLKLIFEESLFVVSSLEDTREYKGTYWALNSIKKSYNDDVYFVLGADNIKELDKWINYEKLLKEYKFIVLTRAEIDPFKIINEKYHLYLNNFSLVDINIDVSSSSFRENPKKKHLINDKVFQYIKENNLYEVNYVKT